MFDGYTAAPPLSPVERYRYERLRFLSQVFAAAFITEYHPQDALAMIRDALKLATEYRLL